jgi:hypothetical protein
MPLRPLPPPLGPVHTEPPRSWVGVVVAVGIVVALASIVGFVARDISREASHWPARREKAERDALPAWIDAHAPGGRATCPLVRGDTVLCDVSAPGFYGVVRVECGESGCWSER